MERSKRLGVDEEDIKMLRITMIVSYTLELLAVLQMLDFFDHHNCVAKVLSYPLHNLA